MVVEHITYGVKSVGHTTPDPERKQIQPSIELVAAFEKWLNGCEWYDVTKSYKQAMAICTDLKPTTIDEIHALFSTHQTHPAVECCFWRIALFVSAAYNKICQEDVIEFNLSLPHVRYIGYHLDENKTLVNRANILNFGTHARGLLINYGDMQSECGFDANVLLNYGNGGHECASTMREIFINMGQTGRRPAGGGVKAAVINFGSCGDTLGDCLEATGILVNAGECGDSTGLCACGRHILIKAPKGYLGDDPCLVDFWTPKLVLKPDECEKIPALKEYFNDLKQRLEAGRTDVQKAIDVMKSLSKKQIEQDLERIITAAGKKW